MVTQWVRFQNWWDSETGASLVEYAFLLLLIAVVAIAVITQVGGNASNAFEKADKGFN